MLGFTSAYFDLHAFGSARLAISSFFKGLADRFAKKTLINEFTLPTGRQQVFISCEVTLPWRHTGERDGPLETPLPPIGNQCSQIRSRCPPVVQPLATSFTTQILECGRRCYRTIAGVICSISTTLLLVVVDISMDSSEKPLPPQPPLYQLAILPQSSLQEQSHQF